MMTAVSQTLPQVISILAEPEVYSHKKSRQRTYLRHQPPPQSNSIQDFAPTHTHVYVHTQSLPISELISAGRSTMSMLLGSIYLDETDSTSAYFAILGSRARKHCRETKPSMSDFHYELEDGA